MTAPEKKKYEKKILSAMAKAVSDYQMIRNGDRIMVCLSGGKDSWTMLAILNILKRKAPITFDLIGVNIDPDFAGYQNNKIAEYCAKIGLPLEIIKTQIKSIIEDKIRPDSSYCSFCARLRRGAIYTTAKKLKVTKIALGHHREDLNETLLMNLFFTGQIKSMAPIMRTDDNELTVIRPLIYASESDIRQYAIGQFPIICCRCPICKDEDQQRKKTKQLLNTLEKDNPTIKVMIQKAMKNVIPSHLLDQDIFDFKAIK